MRTTLNFIFLILLLVSVKPFKVEASTTKLITIEDKDPEGFFRIFREMPEDFTGSNLKIFLKRTGDLYPIDVTYEKKGQTHKSIIYKRYFRSEGYYFTFLTRHNLINEEFFNLENIHIEFNSASSSGFQTKLHYSIYLGNNKIPFSFRILYASELKKNIASTPFMQAYQKTRTKELAKKVARPDSGDWKEALKRQAQVEQRRLEKAQEKSKPTKQFIADQYAQISQATVSPSISTANEASSSIGPAEERPSMPRKFSTHRLQLPASAAKSPPKNLSFKLPKKETKEAFQAIEEKYTSPAQAGKTIVKRQSSRALLAEQRDHKKQFETKRDEEERVDLIEKRSSISSSIVPLLPTSPQKSTERVELGTKGTPSISSPRLKRKEELTSLKEDDEEGSLEINQGEELSEVSQADIQEMFEDSSGSE